MRATCCCEYSNAASAAAFTAGASSAMSLASLRRFGFWFIGCDITFDIAISCSGDMLFMRACTSLA
jgi:hypothetical protein